MHEAWAERIVAAKTAGQLPPALSGEHTGATLEDAFDVQKQVVAALAATRPINGFKAALTAPPAQAAFATDRAVWGVLLGAPHDSGSTLAIDSFGKLMLETEVAFRVGRTIDARLEPAQLGEYFDAVAPAVEFADTGFDGKANAIDLVAGNAAAGAVLVGPATGFADAVADDASITFSRGDATLHSARGGDAPGGQLEALAWLVNQVVDGGYTLAAGHWLITGALGGMQPAEPGDYRADFGPLGGVSFTLT